MKLESITEEYSFSGRTRGLLVALREAGFKIRRGISGKGDYYSITSDIKKDGSMLTFGEVHIPSDKNEKRTLTVYDHHKYSELIKFIKNYQIYS